MSDFVSAFAGVHRGTCAADAGTRSAADAGSSHIFLRQLGAVRRLCCEQRARVRSWDAKSAGAVHGLRWQQCNDRPLRRQLRG